MDETAVMNLVVEVLGVQPLSAVHQTFGHCSVTYEALLPTRSVIVRMNRDARVFATTEHNIAVLAGLGLPTPNMLASDLTCRRVPFAYMILDKIPGRDLRYELGAMTPEQQSRLATQIVEFQRRVGRLPPGHGYGFVGLGEAGPHASWQDLMVAENNKTAATGNDFIDRRQARVQRQAQRFEAYFRAVPPTCFLDDLTVKNVLVQNGELQGLVDFDGVCYGDPLFWLALTATGVVSDVGTPGLFYVEELKRLWGLTPEQEPALALYTAGMALDFLRRASASETPEWAEAPEWIAHMQAAVEQWMADAERKE